MKIKLNIYSDSLHTCGVITGFYMLAKQGKIDMEINDLRHKAKMSDAVIEAVAESKKMVFDLSDGYAYNNREQTEKFFSEADMVFKRSFSEQKNREWEAVGQKIMPYGLNYFVTYKDNPITRKKASLGGFLKTLKLTNSYVEDFEAPVPKNRKKPKILFLTRLWDPNGDDVAGNSTLAEERIYINKVRTDTVRLLKKEFGNSFFGGIYTDGFSAKYCPELLADKAVTLKRVYLERMKNSDICINTMGLHGSVGWKTAEYVAASRAIVSEKFSYQSTGDFAGGKNYLAFATPDECAEQVNFLMENPNERILMCERNKKYYEEYLRPDSQAERALETFFGRKING